MKNEICVVQITQVTKHPSANKLKLCEVFDGTHSHSLVCGADNVRENMLTVLAPINSILPNGKTIELAEIRGEKSFGMLCSAKDLSISEESGIIDLPDHYRLGTVLKNIEHKDLSSTPWYQFTKIDHHYLDHTGKKITVSKTPLKDLKLISETYFDNQNLVYKYRHFL